MVATHRDVAQPALEHAQSTGNHRRALNTGGAWRINVGGGGRAEPVGYIGGTTPFFSTRIRCALNAPPTAGAAVTITFFPAVRSERSAGMNATTGTLAGTVPPMLPPFDANSR